MLTRRASLTAFLLHAASGLALVLENRRPLSPRLFTPRTRQSIRRFAGTELNGAQEKEERELAAAAAPKWSTAVDEFRERIESGKAAVVGAVVGSVCFAPVDLAFQILLDHGGGPTSPLAQWEFNTDAAGLCSALFAVVYRYAVREDANPQLKDGCVGAFVLVRTLATVRVPDGCAALPLSCGPPLGYLDWSMLGQIAQGGIESAAAFGATAMAIEILAARGLLGKFPSS